MKSHCTDDGESADGTPPPTGYRGIYLPRDGWVCPGMDGEAGLLWPGRSFAAIVADLDDEAGDSAWQTIMEILVSRQ